MRILIVYIFFSFLSYNTYALDIGPSTGLTIPRFVSLKSDEVNLRVGPSINYPKELQYIRKNIPVEIIDEYDLWRKIVDIDGNTGWLHKSLIKAERYAIVSTKKDKNVIVFNYPFGRKIGEIGRHNIVKLNSCLKEWCSIYINENQGWMNKDNLWGVYENEIYKPSFLQPVINFYWKVEDFIFKKLF